MRTTSTVWTLATWVVVTVLASHNARIKLISTCKEFWACSRTTNTTVTNLKRKASLVKMPSSTSLRTTNPSTKRNLRSSVPRNFLPPWSCSPLRSTQRPSLTPSMSLIWIHLRSMLSAKADAVELTLNASISVQRNFKRDLTMKWSTPWNPNIKRSSTKSSTSSPITLNAWLLLTPNRETSTSAWSSTARTNTLLLLHKLSPFLVLVRNMKTRI